MSLEPAAHAVLARRSGRLFAAVALTGWLLVDRAVPRRLVGPVHLLLLVLVVFDSVATWAGLRLGVSAEANPLVAGVIAAAGLETGLVLRTLFAAALVSALALLARRSWVARPAMAVVTAVLGAVAVWHVAGLASSLTLLT